jgi:hypothetical protein
MSRMSPQVPVARTVAGIGDTIPAALSVQGASITSDQPATFNADMFDFGPLFGDMSFMPLGDTFDDFIDLSWLDASTAQTQ